MWKVFNHMHFAWMQLQYKNLAIWARVITYKSDLKFIGMVVLGIGYSIVDRSFCEKKNSTTQILLKGYLEKPMPKAHITTLIG